MLAKVRVFLNERSGARTNRRAELEAAFAAHEVPCRVTTIRSGMQLTSLAREAAKTAGTLVVAAGGDGTVNGVASAVTGTQACMAVVACGTLNHFARDLGMPATLTGDVDAIVTAMGQGQTRAVDVGEVNDQVFVNNASLGFYPAMVTQRERLKKVGWNKWVSLMIAAAAAWMRFRHITVCVVVPAAEAGGEPQRLTRTTPFLFIGNNEYTMQGASIGSRKRLDGGRLYLYMAPGATRMSLLRLTLAALRHRVAQEPSFESFCVEECTVEFRRRIVRVALDGEVKRLRGPLRFRIRPAALHVVAPTPSPEPVP